MTDEELIERLLSEGILTNEQLKQVESEAVKKRTPILQTLLSIGILDKESIFETVAEDLGSVYVNLATYMPDPSLKEEFPREVADQMNVLPLFKVGDVVVVATSDPGNLVLMDRLSYTFNSNVEAVYAQEAEIKRAMGEYYGGGDAAEELMRTLEVVGSEGAMDGGDASGGESPVAKLVDLIMTQAVRDRASDVHIEPEEEFLRIRFRIDGVLHEIPSPPKNLELPIISRIKVLSGMDIAESRAPQDGHFQVTVDNKIIDLRVSTLPTISGENVVMRLLDTGSVLIGLEKLGFSEHDLKRYMDIIARPYGVILSTGPTGSGKTTTLYSALTTINSLDRNIITVEDPVEYRIGLIRQVQVNPRAGMTFATGLRSILRQDPDVIMVGEIRDLETGIIAIQSALTGHLVFSTLHTNDAPSAVVRLENMGVEPFLISASVVGILAQRLIRVICLDCKEEYKPDTAIAKMFDKDPKDFKLHRGKGCATCKGTGYKGRSGLYELMTINDELREMILEGTSLITLRNKAMEGGMRTLRQDGMLKVLKGVTTIEEIMRATEEKVEIKAKGPEEVKPVLGAVRAVAGDTAATPAPAARKATASKVDEREVADYQKKIASWLSKK